MKVQIPFIVIIALVLLGGGCVSRKPFRAVPERDRLGLTIRDGTASRSESKGVSWVTSIRADSGINEGDIVLQKVLERVKEMQDVAVSGNPGPVLTIQLQVAGISEVQRGGWCSAVGTAWATLVDVDDDLLWLAIASSTSTKPRRREEYELQPTLYRDDFTEVAEDLARQLIEGPIR